jgi:hypothetical protein
MAAPCCGALAAGHCGTHALLQKIKVLCRRKGPGFSSCIYKKHNSKESAKKLNKVLKKGKNNNVLKSKTQPCCGSKDFMSGVVPDRSIKQST